MAEIIKEPVKCELCEKTIKEGRVMQLSRGYLLGKPRYVCESCFWDVRGGTECLVVDFHLNLTTEVSHDI